MKRILVTAVLGVVLAANTGCCCLDRLFCCNRLGNNGCNSGCNAAPSCDSCGGGGGCACGGGGMGGGAMGGGEMYGHHQPQGPTGAAVAYPYYTTRGPRDYFANNPGMPRN